MKKIFFLVLLIFTVIVFFLIKSFLGISLKQMFVVNLFHDNKVYVNSVNNKIEDYLINKYSLKQSELSFVSENNVTCRSFKTSDSYYCGKEFVYDIKGKTTVVKFKESIDKNIITDNYQSEEISNEVNNKFKNLLGNKVSLIYFSFYPLVDQKTFSRISATDSFINYYNGDIEKFFKDETLSQVNIAVSTNKYEKENIFNEYSIKLKNYAENYCLDKKTNRIQTSFEMYFFDSESFLGEDDLKYTNFYNQDTNENDPRILCTYFFECNTKNYDSNNPNYVFGKCL